MIWRVYATIGFMHDYYAEKVIDGAVVERKNLHAHCLQCAKTDLMAETGEPVDIRGWHLAAVCGAFAKSMRSTIEQEKENNASS